MLKRLHGPDGIVLQLDSDEIYPDDPGQGTPALVINKQGDTATFWCAASEGEIDGNPLSQEACDWLNNKEDYVNEFIMRNTPA